MSNRDIWEQILLDPMWMLELYASGAFPMAPEKNSDVVQWFSPEERAVISPDGFNVPRSVKKLIKEKILEIKLDYNHEAIIRGCAAREKTWISEKLIQAYMRIKRLGFLHTVECYSGNTLAGGLYGISIGRAFFGESMFSFQPGASKVALAYLLTHLHRKGFLLLDVQYMTEHLAMFGAKIITMDEYNRILGEAIRAEEGLNWF